MSAASYDTVVIGAGPAGYTVAIALACAGCRTAIAGPPHDSGPGRDTRTTALLQASVQLLRNTGVWEGCREHAAPLRTIRIIDDTGGLLRAPEVVFKSREIGDEAFGYNIANTELVAALRARAEVLPNLDIIETQGATAIEPADHDARITLAEGSALTARLVAGADGRRSLARQAAGIAARTWRYDQVALACNFSHTRPHDDASLEFHRKSGPFTTVPLPGRTSSLVWVETPDEANRLLALCGADIAGEIETRLQGCLGQISNVGPRASFPLSGMSVARTAANRIALVGEAAHVIPPIGAQGLNLGFRDAAALAECAGAALAEDGDPGGASALAAYDKARHNDVASRIFAVDLLNRSLISGHPPLQAARGLGLHLLGGIAPLRKAFMRAGLAPRSGLPELMRRSAP